MKNTKVNLSSETAEQEAVVEYCDLMRIPVVHIPNEGKRSASYGAQLKRAGMRKGFPDLFIPVPRKGYHGLFIEMKFGKNKTTAEQDKWLALLNSQGYLAVVCRGFEEAVTALKKYFNKEDKQ